MNNTLIKNKVNEWKKIKISAFKQSCALINHWGKIERCSPKDNAHDYLKEEWNVGHPDREFYNRSFQAAKFGVFAIISLIVTQEEPYYVINQGKKHQ